MECAIGSAIRLEWIKMDATLPLYILNVIIVAGMFSVTIYRAWMEKQNLEARRKISQLKIILEREASTIRDLSGEEFIDMLKIVLSEK